MKDLYHLSSRAYKEGYEVLKLLSKEDKDKIPDSIWNFIRENMDLSYELTAQDIADNNLLEETNILLAILYKTYLASTEEKKIIKAKERAVINRKEEEARKKYNINLFGKK